MNPEKLAYILIGVCCGLSILCLIIVAVSIGYKTETHYRSGLCFQTKMNETKDAISIDTRQFL